MKLKQTNIPGCFEMEPDKFEDDRGFFFKTYHVNMFKEAGLEFNWQEEYFSASKKDVIRGMHFQLPPDDHTKLVTCLKGKVLDVVLDIRKNSSTYKKCISFELSEQNRKMIYIPKGCAHGFMSLEDETLMFYKVSSVYNPTSDKGILWRSINFEWPSGDVIVSERDSKHPSIKHFTSPFNYS